MMNASRNQSRGLETDMAANLESVLANMKQESPGENNEMNGETAMEMDNHSAGKDFVNEDQTTSIDGNNGEMICVQDEDGNNMVCTIASMTTNGNNSFNRTPINHIHGKSIAKNSSFMNNNKFHYWNGFKTGRESGDFRCHLCNYSGRSQHCLNKHYRAHKQAGKICRYCLRAFERPSDLVRHEDRHRKRNHPMQSSGIVMEAPSFSTRRLVVSFSCCLAVNVRSLAGMHSSYRNTRHECTPPSSNATNVPWNFPPVLCLIGTNWKVTQSRSAELILMSTEFWLKQIWLVARWTGKTISRSVLLKFPNSCSMFQQLRRYRVPRMQWTSWINGLIKTRMFKLHKILKVSSNWAINHQMECRVKKCRLMYIYLLQKKIRSWWKRMRTHMVTYLKIF